MFETTIIRKKELERLRVIDGEFNAIFREKDEEIADLKE
jgi:hypothetical protein